MDCRYNGKYTPVLDCLPTQLLCPRLRLGWESGDQRTAVVGDSGRQPPCPGQRWRDTSVKQWHTVDTVSLPRSHSHTPWHTFISTSSNIVTSHNKSKRVNQVITVVRSWIEFWSRSTRVHASSWYQENILFGAVKRRCFDDPVHCETPALIAAVLWCIFNAIYLWAQ